MGDNLVWIEVKNEDQKTPVIRREAKGEVIDSG